MNFLAHAYLSFGHPQVLLGNMMSDFVKGKKMYDYPVLVQAGITLHRKIDSYTDEHAITKQAKQFFRNPYRLYSGPIMDIVYDYFLANDTHIFPPEQLNKFVLQVYDSLNEHQQIMPEHFKKVFYYMQQQNWLYNYRFKWGFKNSLEGLVRRASYINNAQPAFELFELHYDALQQLYSIFIEDISNYAYNQFTILIGKGE